MRIELNKKDFVYLVKGTNPSYEMMAHPLVKRCGTYCGGFNDRWTWNEEILVKLSEEQLLELYNLCK